MRVPGLLVLMLILALVVSPVQVEQASPSFVASAPCTQEQGANLFVPTAIARLRGGASVEFDGPSLYEPDP